MCITQWRLVICLPFPLLLCTRMRILSELKKWMKCTDSNNQGRWARQCHLIFHNKLFPLFICLCSSPRLLLPSPAVFWGMQFQREWKGNVLFDSISIELNWIKWESIIWRHCLSVGVMRALFTRWCLKHHICPTVSAQ